MPPYPHMPGYSIPYPLANGNAGTLLLGQPVYSSAPGQFNLAQANALATAIVIGVVAVATVLPGAIAPLQRDSEIAQLTTAAWDALCGTSGGLTRNTRYYVSPTTPGLYTSVAPTTPGQVVAPVLLGLSPTLAQVLIVPPILL